MEERAIYTTEDLRKREKANYEKILDKFKNDLTEDAIWEAFIENQLNFKQTMKVLEKKVSDQFHDQTQQALLMSQQEARDQEYEEAQLMEALKQSEQQHLSNMKKNPFEQVNPFEEANHFNANQFDFNDPIVNPLEEGNQKMVQQSEEKAEKLEDKVASPEKKEDEFFNKSFVDQFSDFQKLQGGDKNSPKRDILYQFGFEEQVKQKDYVKMSSNDKPPAQSSMAASGGVGGMFQMSQINQMGGLDSAPMSMAQRPKKKKKSPRGKKGGPSMMAPQEESKEESKMFEPSSMESHQMGPQDMMPMSMAAPEKAMKASPQKEAMPPSMMNGMTPGFEPQQLSEGLREEDKQNIYFLYELVKPLENSDEDFMNEFEDVLSLQQIEDLYKEKGFDQSFAYIIQFNSELEEKHQNSFMMGSGELEEEVRDGESVTENLFSSYIPKQPQMKDEEFQPQNMSLVPLINEDFSDPILEQELVELYTKFRNKRMLDAAKALQSHLPEPNIERLSKKQKEDIENDHDNLLLFLEEVTEIMPDRVISTNEIFKFSEDADEEVKQEQERNQVDKDFGDFPELLDSRALRKAQDRNKMHNDDPSLMVSSGKKKNRRKNKGKEFIKRERDMLRDEGILRSDHENKLREIEKRYPNLNTNLIYKSYRVFNIPRYVSILMSISFPKMSIEKQFEGQAFILDGRGARNRATDVALNPSGNVSQAAAKGSGDSFEWTREIIRKFNKWHRVVNHDQVYQHYRKDPIDKINAEIRGAQNQAFEARKVRDITKANKYLGIVNDLKKEKERIMNLSEHALFDVQNSEETINKQIDLHGLQKKQAREIVVNQINSLQEKINSGLVVPNVEDGKNHVLKIICGKGNHSQGRAVLKYAIDQLLRENYVGDDCYCDVEQGNFLVRFKKGGNLNIM